jgi:hypothetical protein
MNQIAARGVSSFEGPFGAETPCRAQAAGLMIGTAGRSSRFALADHMPQPSLALKIHLLI